MQISSPVYWVGVLMALSPTIVHSIEVLARQSWSHYVIVAPFLLAICVRHESSAGITPPRVGVGSAVLLLAMALQLLGIAGGSWSIARIGLPLAAMGVALALGRPPQLPMVLCFWVVPVPYFLVNITTPWAETLLAAGAASIASMLGADVTASGPLIRSGDMRLELESFQGGVITALVLFELGWYSSVRGAHPSWIGALRTSLIYSLAVVVVQPVAVIVAVFIFRWQGPGMAELWLGHGVWLVTAAICIGSTEYRESKKCAA